MSRTRRAARASTSPGRQAAIATAVLLGVTAAWGSTFFLIKDLLERMPTLDFLAVRFTIASLAMVVAAPRALTRLDPTFRRHALVLGLVYGVGQILQTTGIGMTPATVSGFITGMYVVFTPLLVAPLLGSRIEPLTWVAVVVATVGLGVLTLGGFSVGVGELLVLAAAVLYALHIVGLGAWSRPDQAIGMSIVQIIVIAVVCLLVTAPNGITLPDRPGDWVAIVYTAVVAGALAMLGQTWAQAHLPPTRTAIIMTMEPVFAAFFAVLLGGETMTGRMVLGGLLVLTAMVMVELVPRRHVEAEVTHIAN